MGSLRQEYWRGLPFPSSRDLPHSGIKLASPALPLGFFTAEPPEKPNILITLQKKKAQYLFFPYFLTLSPAGQLPLLLPFLLLLRFVFPAPAAN